MWERIGVLGMRGAPEYRRIEIKERTPP